MSKLTNALVDSFADALKAKLEAAELKYGYAHDEWSRPDWEETCFEHMRAHIEKGDPRDVAIYAAFMWHHGWSTNGRRVPV